ncbi:universal stress protein [Vaginella massiliensis]|uniref:universal stress protein n=1 Tax=Vaginella massiliensis TaxID=1816680 RepID=UPI0037500D9B
MKKILFPTDFSETAKNALIYALNLAENQNAEVYVLHSYSAPIINSGTSPELIFSVYESIELGTFENFKDQIPEIRELAEQHNLGHIPMKFIMKEGFLVANIQDVVSDENIDFVVMGTNGASGIDKVLFGSNTMNVISKLKTPVLCVPIEASFNGVKSICFTTNFEEKDKDALYHMLEIAERYNAIVHCLHISSNEEIDKGKELIEWQQVFANEPVQFHVIYNEKDVEKAAMDFIDANGVDVVASVARHRSFFEKLFGRSFTKKLAYHSKIPMYVFHEKK